jgi:lysophospholipase L1-like esterase
MPDFVNDNVALPEPKDEQTVPLGKEARFIRGQDYNALRDAALSLRTVVQEIRTVEPTPVAITKAAEAAASAVSAASSLAGAVAAEAGAEASASSAGSAKTAAEVARDAANATGKVYPDTASGIAAVAEGEYFNVPSALASETLILYRKEAGVAVEKKRYVAKIEMGFVPKKNLFDPAAVTEGVEVYATDGHIAAQADSSVSDFIDVYGLDALSVSGLAANAESSRYYVFLGADKTTVVGATGNISFAATSKANITVPMGAYYFRFSPRQRHPAGPDYATAQVEAGGVITAFAAYDPNVVSLNGRTLGPGGLLSASSIVAAPQRNKFNAATVIEGFEVYGTGVIQAQADSSVSDFIPVHGETGLSITGLQANPAASRYYVFLGADKTTNVGVGYISAGINSGSVAVPATAYYFRFSPRQRNASPGSYGAVQVEAGASSPFVAYSPRAATLGGVQVPDPDAGSHAGRSYLLFGDSITETATVLDDGTYTEGYRSNWPRFFGSMVRASGFVNYAKSGAAYRDRTGLTSEWQKISHQITKANEHGKTADVVIVAAGTNDGTDLLGDFATATGKATLGDLDRTKLYEALRWAFWQIRTFWPNATCFVVTPIQRPDVTPESRETMYAAIVSMAQRYNVIVIDGRNESGIVRDFEVAGSAGRDLSDGLHPATSGQEKMARLIAAKVRGALNY